WMPESFLSGNTSAFDPTRFAQGLTSTVIAGGPPGFTYPGDPGFPNGKTGSYTQWSLWAPHAGIAWDPFGNGKTSIRASYSMSNGQYGMHYRDDQGQEAPWNRQGGVQVPQGTSTTRGSFDNPWSGNPGEIDPVPFTPGTFAP